MAHDVHRVAAMSHSAYLTLSPDLNAQHDGDLDRTVEYCTWKEGVASGLL